MLERRGLVGHVEARGDVDAEVNQARDFKDAAFGIMGALRQVGFAGTDEQRARALEVLNETKRKLYAVLADSE